MEFFSWLFPGPEKTKIPKNYENVFYSHSLDTTCSHFSMYAQSIKKKKFGHGNLV